MVKCAIDQLVRIIEAAAGATGFSGAVRVSDGVAHIEAAYGEADRRDRTANTCQTRFAVASGSKLFTALAIGSLVDDGLISLDDRLVDVVDLPLPNIDPRVTIDHLLSHTSGVYDYYDEELIDDFDSFEMSVPPRALVETADYLPMLVAGPQKFAPGARFSYSNSGYVLLGLAIEAVTGAGYHQVVARRVLERANMTASGYFRFDALPDQVAVGYIEGGSTSAERLPIIGGPDGGAFSTVADIERLWRRLLAGDIISTALLERFVEPRSRYRDQIFYGRGLWVRGDTLFIEGSDAGVSFKSSCYSRATIATVMSNGSDGAWPIAAAIDAAIA